jgi:hypothetical protein
MSVRSFDWRDIPALIKYRNQCVFLDSALVLTRGLLMVPGSLLSYIAPNVGVQTSVALSDASKQKLIGQSIHNAGSQFSHLTFLSPESALDNPSLPALLENLAVHSGERGALRLLAEVDEETLAFEVLRQSSFAIYSRQRIWRMNASANEEKPANMWRMANSRDLIAIRSLYNNLVPGLVQQVEPYSTQNPQGLIYYQDGELLAYVEVKYGHQGIWAQPFVHPDAEDVALCLFNLMQNLPYRGSRPVYICIRSYQSWLESAIQELEAEPGPRQSVMVKHLAVAQKAVKVFALPALEGGHPEVTAPMARSESK